MIGKYWKNEIGSIWWNLAVVEKYDFALSSCYLLIEGYHIYSNIPAAGLAFQIMKKAGLLERRVYWIAGIMPSVPCEVWFDDTV